MTDITSLSKHGYSQKVLLPKKYRLPGTHVKISRLGKGLYIEPIDDSRPRTLGELLESLPPVSEDFMKDGRPKHYEEPRREPLFE